MTPRKPLETHDAGLDPLKQLVLVPRLAVVRDQLFSSLPGHAASQGACLQQMEPREPLEVQILRARLRTLEELDHPAADALRAQLPAHLLFVPTPHGYELVGRDGSPPAAGAEVAVDGRRLVVAKVGRSPLPDDRRRCAFLIA